MTAAAQIPLKIQRCILRGKEKLRLKLFVPKL